MPFVRPTLNLGHLAKHDLEETVESIMQRYGYDVLESIGSGGVAIVCRAVCHSSGKVIAVKCYRSQDDEFRQFVRDEYNIMSNLRHHAVLRAEGIRESRHRVLLLLDWCSRGSVNSHIRRHGPFSEFDARGFLHQLHKGVDYLHANRTIHCDLKPDNVLLTHQMVLKISDFNSASKIGDNSNILLSERGDRLFSAPELRLGCIWNERVDVWACGLCAYFVLFGSFPFNITDRKVGKCVFEGVLPPINWKRTSAPENESNSISEVMQNHVLGCLVIPPSDRPSAMETLLHPIFVLNSSAPPPWSLSPLLTPAWHLSRVSLPPFLSRPKQSSSLPSSNMISHEASIFEVHQKDHQDVGYACLTSAVLLTTCGLVSTRATRPCVDLSGVKPCANSFGEALPKLRFIESRYGHDAMRRLAMNRWERTMKLDDNGSSRVGRGRVSMLSLHREFTTHAATQPDEENDAAQGLVICGYSCGCDYVCPVEFPRA